MTESGRPQRDRTVGQLLLGVSRLVHERMRVKMQGIGIHRAQGFALFFLAHHDGVPQTEIARSFHLSPATVTNMLQRMERDGWIERHPDPDDQRVSRVYLTKRARALQAEAEGAFRELEHEVTSALTPEEQADLHALLLKVRERLSSELPEGRHPNFPFADAGGEES